MNKDSKSKACEVKLLLLGAKKLENSNGIYILDNLKIYTSLTRNYPGFTINLFDGTYKFKICNSYEDLINQVCNRLND